MMIYCAPFSRIALYISEGVQVGRKKRRKKECLFMNKALTLLSIQISRFGEALTCTCAHRFSWSNVLDPPSAALSPESGIMRTPSERRPSQVIYGGKSVPKKRGSLMFSSYEPSEGASHHKGHLVFSDANIDSKVFFDTGVERKDWRKLDEAHEIVQQPLCSPRPRKLQRGVPFNLGSS